MAPGRVPGRGPVPAAPVPIGGYLAAAGVTIGAVVPAVVALRVVVVIIGPPTHVHSIMSTQ